jgi:hypothetical protein
MALPAWPFYGVGSVVVLVGFAALHRWLQGLTGRLDHPPRSVLVTAFVAFLLGSGTLVLAIGIDSENVQVENTRTFRYDVTITANGTGPFRIVLPAPEDPRLWEAFNRTSGASTMRYVPTGPVPSVQIDTPGNVTFSVEVQVFGARFLTNLTRLDRPAGGATSASVVLTDSGSGAAYADIVLAIRFTEYCAARAVTIDGTVPEGTSAVPVQDGRTVC